MSRRVFYCLIIAAVLFLGLDIAFKRYVFFHISPFQGVPVFRDFLGIGFSLEYVKNTGAAWGFLSSLQSYLLWGRCAIILGLLGFVFFSSVSLARKAFLSWIIAGAFGNVLDFFIYGHVVDMLHFCFWGYSFAVFNIADSMIFCGVLALFIQQHFESRSQKKKT